MNKYIKKKKSHPNETLGLHKVIYSFKVYEI